MQIEGALNYARGRFDGKNAKACRAYVELLKRTAVVRSNAHRLYIGAIRAEADSGPEERDNWIALFALRTHRKVTPGLTDLGKDGKNGLSTNSKRTIRSVATLADLT